MQYIIMQFYKEDYFAFTAIHNTGFFLKNKLYSTGTIHFVWIKRKMVMLLCIYVTTVIGLAFISLIVHKEKLCLMLKKQYLEL